MIKILLVEDEMIIAAKISMQLTELGYEVTAILPRGEEAIEHVKNNRPDIAILDIQLKGRMDGIETAKQIKKLADIPILFLTANGDEATFNRAKLTRPAAFISKPFKQIDLQRSIELAINLLLVDNANCNDDITIEQHPIILNDRLFIRCRDKMIKILIADILYIEADRNYSRIFTNKKEYLLTLTLKTIESKLPPELFVRVHRSYIINLSHVDEVANGYLLINEKSIPLSGNLRENLLERIQTL